MGSRMEKDGNDAGCGACAILWDMAPLLYARVRKVM